MRELMDYAVTTLLALILIIGTYQYLGGKLSDVIDQAFDGLAVQTERKR